VPLLYAGGFELPEVVGLVKTSEPLRQPFEERPPVIRNNPTSSL
jgi:hypothetical protein